MYKNLPREKYPLATVGMGPAGMSVSQMASMMGLDIFTIEKNQIGGECLNRGCVPSKSLIEMAKYRSANHKFKNYGLDPAFGSPDIVESPFGIIGKHLEKVNGRKQQKKYEKTNLHLGKVAEFISKNEIVVKDLETGEPEKIVQAKKFFICTGTEPSIPPIPGLREMSDELLTNNNMFKLDKVPKSLLILGAGAIGVEMAQAFSRMGSEVTIVQNLPYVIPISGDPETGDLIKKVFEEEGIKVYNSQNLVRAGKTEDGQYTLETDEGVVFKGEKMLVAAGRSFEPNRNLGLEKAGVVLGRRGEIIVDDYLRAKGNKNIYGVGDCNGHILLSSAAMHQGMIAFMNSMLPWGLRKKYKDYPVPWTVFTDPQVSGVGETERSLQEKGIEYDVVKLPYESYGAAVAMSKDVGFIKVFVSKKSIKGKILGVLIVGEASGEMINVWSTLMTHGLTLVDLLFTIQSFPTYGWMHTSLTAEYAGGLISKYPFVKKLVKHLY